MMGLAFEFDWADPGKARGHELRATWATLSIRVNGQSATIHRDTETGELSECLCLPLYPLAEWLVTHWWALRSEVWVPHLPRSRTFARRHDLAAARQGFALPALQICSEGPETRLRWQAASLPSCRLDFVSGGDQRLPSEDVCGELSRFVNAVCARLGQQGLEASWLQHEWRVVQETLPDEAEFCAAVAAAGLDPYDLSEGLADQLLSVIERVPRSLREDALALVDGNALVEGLDSIFAALAIAHRQPTQLTELVAVRGAIRAAGSDELPWQQGYERARELRHLLGLDGQVLPSWQALRQALRVSEADAAGAIHGAAGLARYDAVVGQNAAGSPGFVLRRPPEQVGGRFALVRALHEYLVAPDGSPGAIVSRAQTARQSCSRAFAAEFLAPREALAARLENSAADDACIGELADEFGVSEFVIWHQIDNHGLAPLATSWEPATSSGR